jgi:pyruvate,water dikinase
VIIATGGQARTIPGIDPDGERVMTYRSAIVLRELPESVVIVGAGPIGMEFAQVWSSYGTEVTVDAFNGRVYRGRVQALLESGLQRGGFMTGTPAYRALRRRADLIVPLHLLDPRSPHFSPENCRTVHDIMRYIHEKSYAEIFQLGDHVTDRGNLSVRFKGPLPIDLHVIDLGGGLCVDAATVSSITAEKIVSPPFTALLRGMCHEGLRPLEPRPVNFSGFFSVMSRQLLTPPNTSVERFGDRSYAIISDCYLNFSSRVGYHYSILDCYCGKTLAKNYINFEFKGGAADDRRRNRRARLIAHVLTVMGFFVRTDADR